MRKLIFAVVFSLVGCVDLGNDQINTVRTDWIYMRSDAPGYQGRDRSNTGNCVEYAVAAYNDLLSRGYDKARLRFWACKIDGQDHMVCVVDGHMVYSVGEQWVLEKDDLNWEWVWMGS